MPKIISENLLFEKTIEILISKGYEKTTTKAIAEAADVNETTIFRKFGTKAGLIAHAVRSMIGSTSMMTIQYTGDVENDLLNIIRNYIQTNELYGDLIPVLLSEFPRYPELADVLEAPYQMISSVFKIIRQYQIEGLLEEEPEIRTISHLLGPIIIERMLRKLIPENAIVELNSQEYLNRFLNGYRRTKEHD